MIQKSIGRAGNQNDEKGNGVSLIIAAVIRYSSYTGLLCPAPKTSSEIIDSITKIQNDLSEAQKIVKEGIRR